MTWWEENKWQETNACEQLWRTAWNCAIAPEHREEGERCAEARPQLVVSFQALVQAPRPLWEGCQFLLRVWPDRTPKGLGFHGNQLFSLRSRDAYGKTTTTTTLCWIQFFKPYIGSKQLSTAPSEASGNYSHTCRDSQCPPHSWVIETPRRCCCRIPHPFVKEIQVHDSNMFILFSLVLFQTWPEGAGLPLTLSVSKESTGWLNVDHWKIQNFYPEFWGHSSLSFLWDPNANTESAKNRKLTCILGVSQTTSNVQRPSAKSVRGRQTSLLFPCFMSPRLPGCPSCECSVSRGACV